MKDGTLIFICGLIAGSLISISLRLADILRALNMLAGISQ